MTRIVIVGGGLAGLAAAQGLRQSAAERGQRLRITLLEAKRQLGGRAGSWVTEQGERIDHCQHVAMGCCVNWLAFCRRVGLAPHFESHRKLHFVDRCGRTTTLGPSPWLPAPLHWCGAALRLRGLSWPARWRLAAALLHLFRRPPADDGPTMADWLRRRGQTGAALETVWTPVLVSALGDTLDRVSARAARQVLLDGFAAHPDASTLFIPKLPLGVLFDQLAARQLQSMEIEIRRETPVTEVSPSGLPDGVWRVATGRGDAMQCDFVVLAAPWFRVAELLPAEAAAPDGLLAGLRQWPAAPITAAHLWFDRQLTALPHAVLPGRLSQWVFCRGAAETLDGQPAHYYQIVVSGAHELTGQPREPVRRRLLAELQEIWPAAREAQLLDWRLVTQRDAVFTMRPGIEAARPAQVTRLPGLLLAGDWTRTGWPATMEGAVRSGYLAAEAIGEQLWGRRPQLLVPDLPQNWLVRRMLGKARFDHRGQKDQAS